MGLPNKLKEAREKAGFTQTALSKKAHVARTIVVGIENGTIDVVRTSTLTKLSDALGQKISSIFLSNKFNLLN